MNGLSGTDIRGTEAIDYQAHVPAGSLCAACGSPVDSYARFCPACGITRAEAVPAAVAERKATGADGRKVLRCQTCSSELAADIDQRSFTCPFCDSTYVVEFRADESPRQRPEFVIGFAMTPDQASEKFRDWIRDNGWFRPGDLRLTMIVEKMRGVYLPFWTFSMLATSRWSANIGEYWYRTETYTERDAKGNLVTKTRQVRETEWWPLSGGHHRYYSGYLVSGSRGLKQQDADRILPFQMPAMQRYEPYFLSGWLSEEYSVQRDEAFDRCRQVIQRWVHGNIAAFLPGDTYAEPIAIETEFSQINSDLCLLPVYCLTYRYRNKVYAFRMNGQTGKFTGEKPIAWGRVALCVAVVAGLVVLIAGVVAAAAAMSR
ncbi:MAG: zinc ribbon domain-containing protein [Planctomycetes bacterium]|nr:zinc ribbon domain-containing protein [Planctomycetota bacterium]